jgi:hypothetical protein
MVEAERRENDVAPRPGHSDGGISLAALKSRRVPVEWFEAVAVIQELCRALSGAGVDAANVSLSASDVVIESAGSLRLGVNGAAEAEPAVRKIGQLLRMTLAEGAFPVPLRLVIAQSASMPPFYASIAELSRALEYFERPDRPGLIRAVYARAQSYPAVAHEEDETLQQTEQTPALKNNKPASQNRPRRGVSKAVIVACGAAIAAVAIGFAVVSALSNRSAQAAAITGVETDDVGKSMPTSIVAKTVAESSLGDARNPDDKAFRSLPRAVQPESDVVASAPSDALPVLASEAESAALDLSVEAAAADDEPPATAINETMVYSAINADVVPPVATYPRIPAEPPTGVGSESLSTLELLISETGHVESVKLKRRPAYLGEALMATLNLSAAKTWRFQPAVKDGRPVKYRAVVQVLLKH